MTPENEERRPSNGRRSKDQRDGMTCAQNTAPSEPVQLAVCPIACAGIRCVFACPVVTE